MNLTDLTIRFDLRFFDISSQFSNSIDDIIFNNVQKLDHIEIRYVIYSI